MYSYQNALYSSNSGDNFYFYNQYQYSTNHKSYPAMELDSYYRSLDTKLPRFLGPAEKSSYFQNGPLMQHHQIQDAPVLYETVPCPVFHHSRLNQSNYQGFTKHQANICISSTQNGVYQAIAKHKRKRTVFTTEQIQALEKMFKKKKYILREDRKAIADQLQLNERAVKIWFQNHRSKNKKYKETTVVHKIEPKYNNNTQFDQVDVELSEKIEKNAKMSLGGEFVKDVLHIFNTSSQHKSNICIENTTERDNNPVYEPISPASVCDSNSEDNISCWNCTSPEESLRALFDLKTMFLL